MGAYIHETMKHKIKDILLVLLVIVITGVTIKTCKLQNDNRLLSEELDTSEDQLAFLRDHPFTKTDTLYQDSAKLRKPQPLPSEVKPFRVIHPTESKSLTESSDIRIAEADSFSGISTRDSLIGVDLNKNQFTFTFKNSSLGIHSADFKIKPDEYHYVWVDGKLTAKRLPLVKRIKLAPYTSFSYRPIHNLWDLEVGISFKTKSLNYNLGLSGFYYPRWQSKPGMDATIRITYNF